MFFTNKKNDHITTEGFNEVLERGVDRIVVEEHLKNELESGRKLRIKFGIDPTSPNIHLGRSGPLLELRDFQKLGHTIIFIVGDFTGVIGDTSDKESERPQLTHKQIEENRKTYFKQAGKILNLRKTERYLNSKWLKKLTYQEICEQTNQFSVADFIARDNIKKRLRGGTRVSLRETLYPVMQGYDSVVVRADVEIGGTDQWFNLLSGRKLQEHYNQRPQNILTTPILEGLDGRKMSSSWGNDVNINDAPDNMYGKIMSIKDDLIISYLTLCTRVPLKEIQKIRQGLLEGSLHHKDAKSNLAREIVEMYHGNKKSNKAEKSFKEAFHDGTMPEEGLKILVKKGTLLINALVEAGVVRSKNDYRRLIESGAITVISTREKISDIKHQVDNNTDLRVGKKRFVRIRVKT